MSNTRNKINKAIRKLLKMNIIGGNLSGARSCVTMKPLNYSNVEEIWKSSLSSHAPMITKILSDKNAFENELLIVKYIDIMFKHLNHDTQMNILYPLKASVCHRTSLPASQQDDINTILNECVRVDENVKYKGILTFNRDSKILYLFELQYGGITLERIFTDGLNYTHSDEDICKIIEKIIIIMSELHTIGIAYKDVNVKNIIIEETEDSLDCYFIDLGECVIWKDIIIDAINEELKSKKKYRDIISDLEKSDFLITKEQYNWIVDTDKKNLCKILNKFHQFITNTTLKYKIKNAKTLNHLTNLSATEELSESEKLTRLQLNAIYDVEGVGVGSPARSPLHHGTPMSEHGSPVGKFALTPISQKRPASSDSPHDTRESPYQPRKPLKPRIMKTP
jgi:hypothetical protein